MNTAIFGKNTAYKVFAWLLIFVKKSAINPTKITTNISLLIVCLEVYKREHFIPRNVPILNENNNFFFSSFYKNTK
jgi:hypothetical protein